MNNIVNSETKVLIVGDLHLDDKSPVRYVDYKQDSLDTMQMVIDRKNEVGADLTIIAGDFIGLGQSATFKTYDMLNEVIEFLEKIKPAIVIKGNHDHADNSVYDFLEKRGYMLTSKSFEDNRFDIGEKQKLRFHLVDYDADRELEMLDQGYNIIIAHGDYSHNGALQSKRIDEHYNWQQADYIVSGHMHVPTMKLEPQMRSDKSGSYTVLNLGSLNRTSRNDNYDEVNTMIVDANSKQVSVSFKVLELKPFEETFMRVQSTLGDMLDDTLDESQRQNTESLEELLDLVSERNITYGNIETFIKTLPIQNEASRKLALKYYGDAQLAKGGKS